MPGMKTHNIFGLRAASFMPADLKSRIARHPVAYAIGQQGPDLFFYSLSPYLAYSENPGVVMHSSRVMDFFDALLSAREEILNSDEGRSIADAYICGFIGHYTLDSTCHPYIYCRTRKRRHADRPVYDFGLHVFLETDIDSDCGRYYLNQEPLMDHTERYFKASASERKVLTLLLSRAIGRTYPELGLKSWTIYESLLSLPMTARLLRDPSDAKRKLLRRAEELSMGHAVVSGMLVSNHIRKYPDPCNLSHQTWYNPWDPGHRPRRESIMDLIDDSTAALIRRVELYFEAVDQADANHGQADFIPLLEDLGDRSYLTGYTLED